MIDAFIEALGPYADTFDLDRWIHDVDASETRVITGSWWEFWRPVFEAEVRRRGLPIATTTPVRDRAAEEHAQSEAVLKLVQDDDARAAGGIPR